MKNGFKKFSVLFFAWSVAILFAGCSGGNQSVNTVERQQPLGSPDIVLDKRIIKDRSLDKTLSIVAVNTATVSNDLLKVQVELINRTNRVQRFLYKFEWFDMEGMFVQTTPSIWKPYSIEGGESIVVTGIAPNSQTKDFKLKLLEDKNK